MGGLARRPTSSPRHCARRATTRRSASPTSGTGSRRPPTSTACTPPDARPLARRARARADRGEGAHRARARARDQGRRPAHPQRRVGELRRRARPRPRSRTRSASRRRTPPHDVLARRAVALADDGIGHADRLRLRRRAHASPTSISSRSRTTPPTRAVPAARRQARSRPAHPGDPRSARHPFGARRAVERVQRRVDAEGPFVVRRSRRRADRRAARARSSTTRPIARALGAAQLRRRRRPDPAQRAHRRRRAAGLPAQRVHRAGAPARARPASATRGFRSTPGVGVRALRLEPGAKSPEEIMASVPARRSTCSR